MEDFFYKFYNYNISLEKYFDSEENEENIKKEAEHENFDSVRHYEFILPIQTISHEELNDEVIKDLEIDTKPFYELLGKDSPYSLQYPHTNNKLREKLINNMSKYYTTDKQFLNENYEVIKHNDIQPVYNSIEENNYNIKKCNNAWCELKKESSFREKFNFINYPSLLFLNNSPKFMQSISIYQLLSPLMSICLPVIFLILPFIIIKFFMRVPLTFDNYYKILKQQLGNHSLVKVFDLFSGDTTPTMKLYLIMIVLFYIFSIYQNIIFCIRYYFNIKQIKGTILQLKKYMDSTQENINKFVNNNQKYKSFRKFNNYLKDKVLRIMSFAEYFDCILDDRESFSFSDIFKLGGYMTSFYNIFYNDDLDLLFSFMDGFNEYIDIINRIQLHMISDENQIHKCSFYNNDVENLDEIILSNSEDEKVEKKKENKRKKYMIKEMFYPHMIDIDECNIVKNDIDVNMNYNITGVNASGKTTLIKSTILNIILSQQIGGGCYKTAVFEPYDYFHSYINIPDTSDRDSLFQAEARRCKNIIDCIRENDSKKHLCIFDELFSGTNSEEAIKSTIAFLKYMGKYDITYLLTTHFNEITNEKYTNSKNIHMICSLDTSDNIIPQYTYEKGVNNIKGGIKVLKQLEFPSEIIDLCK